MTLQLLGFEFDTLDKQYGFWLLDFTKSEFDNRSLFCIWYSWRTGLYLNLFFFKILTGY